MQKQEGWMIIANPMADGRRGLRHWPLLSNLMYHHGVEFTCVFTQHRKHAVELAVSAIAKGYRKIAVFGGLGTFHDAVNASFIQKTCDKNELLFAFIPIIRSGYLGSAAHLRPLHPGINSYEAAARAMKEPETFRYPIASVSFFESKVRHTSPMVLNTAIGFEAGRNMEYNRLQDKGIARKISGILAIVKAAINYESDFCEITAPSGNIFSGKVISGNISYTVNPEKPEEGYALSASIIRKNSTFQYFTCLPSLISGKMHRKKSTVKTRCSSLSISGRLDNYGCSERKYGTLVIDGETSGCTPSSITLENDFIHLLKGKALY